MAKKSNRPRKYDAVLGGKNPPPVDAAVLGGIEGVKMRLAAEDELIRIAAVEEAMKYGEAGLEVAIASLNDKSPRVREAVINLLEQQRNQKGIITTNSAEDRLLAEIPAKNRLIKVYHGDITNLRVDVIVSSDDRRLKMGGGVARRIREVGGEDIYNEVRKIAPIDLGEIVVTDAGKLQAKKVFHPAVIDWSNPRSTSPELINPIVCNCIAMAGARYQMNSIALPLLGTGAGLLEPEEVWEAMLWAVKNEVSSNIREVAIAIYGTRIVRALNLG